MRDLIKFLPWLVVLWLICMLASLKLGWLDPFFWAAQNATVQGIDYFALPKSFLNLIEGRSLFDTWGGERYGPYATWYLAHPAFSVFVMSWFSFLPPWPGYAAFVIFSLLLMFYSAFLFAKHANDSREKGIYYALMIVAFPVYWMLYVGNMHAPLILATSLLLLAVYELLIAENEVKEKSANKKLLAGLLISFFSKPIVLLLLPAFLLVKESRKTTFYALIIYGIVSLLFIVVPFLNPEGVGIPRLLDVMFDFDYIKDTMNIYKNKFVLTEYMKDNAIHWLNLIAQSEHRLNHIEVFSFPVFLDTLLGKELSASIFKIPVYFCLLSSVLIYFVKKKTARLQILLLLIIEVTLSFFLSYNSVWEYQYASMMPVLAIFYLLKDKEIFMKTQIWALLIIGTFFYLPSFYFLIDKSSIDLTAMTVIRINRVVPALLIFLIVAFRIMKLIKDNAIFEKASITDQP